MKIALIPMAAKPYHAGHDGLVRIASNENDEVHLFVSTSDRKRPGELPILGSTMQQIWVNFIEPILPQNVIVYYGGTPVSKVYKELENAESSVSKDEYTVYSDVEDILKYSDEKLEKSAPTMFSNGQIMTRGIRRSETAQVSGAQMRKFLKDGDEESFISFLPLEVQRHGKSIYNMLKNDFISESLIRKYVKTLLENKI
jgi:nicotinamide mononucleotide adenylyltransferase